MAAVAAQLQPPSPSGPRVPCSAGDSRPPYTQTVAPGPTVAVAVGRAGAELEDAHAHAHAQKAPLRFADEWRRSFGGEQSLHRESDGDGDGDGGVCEPGDSADTRDTDAVPAARTGARTGTRAHSFSHTAVAITPPVPLVLDLAPFAADQLDHLDHLGAEPTPRPHNPDSVAHLAAFPGFGESFAALLGLDDSRESSEGLAVEPAGPPRFYTADDALASPSPAFNSLDETATFLFPSRPVLPRSGTPRASLDLIDLSTPVTSTRQSLVYSSHPSSPTSPTRPPMPMPISIPTSTPTRKNRLSLEREPMVGDEAVDARPSIELELEHEHVESDEYDEEDYDIESDQEDEEEEDPDSHPLYTLLSTSSLAALRSTWDCATLILVPPRRTLPSLSALTPAPAPTTLSPLSSPTNNSGFEFVRGAKGVEGEVAGRDSERDGERLRSLQEEYVGLHAFTPVPKDAERWRSVGSHDGGYVGVRMEPARGLVHVEWVVERDPSPSLGLPQDRVSQGRSEGVTASGSETSLWSSSSNPPQLSPSSAPIPFPSIEPRRSTDSEASEITPRTPPQPVSPPPPPPPVTPLDRKATGRERDLHLSTSPTPLRVHPSSEHLAPPARAPTKRSTAPRPLQIVSETTIYRRPRPTASATSPALPSVPVVQPKPATKPAFRAPKWLRRGTPASKAAPYTPPTKPKEPSPVLERVRVIAVDGQIVLDWLGAQQAGTGSAGRTHAGASSSRLLSRSVSSAGFGGSKSQLSLLQQNRSFEPPPGNTRMGRAGSIASTRSARSGRSAGTVWATAGGAGTVLCANRDFLVDLATLATPPPVLAPVGEALTSVVEIIVALVRDFKSSFAYIKGFDAYTVQRIRKGILEKAWSQLVVRLAASEVGASLVSDEANLPQLVENVVMGLLHAKLYAGSIVPQFTAENSAINHILALYRDRDLTPADLGVDICDFGRGEALTCAVTAMALLGCNASPTPSSELLAALEPSADNGVETLQRELAEARTPLGCISVMRLAIEEIVAAVETATEGARVVPDDLIPLVAWVTVQSGAEDLESLLYYVKTFRLSDTLAAEFDWSFVTFQATLAFLLSDPLDALVDSPLPSVDTISCETTLSSSPTTRRASDLPSFRPRWSSVHTPYNVPPTVRSPPGSPRSLRTVSSHRSGGGVQRAHSRPTPLDTSPSSFSSVREKRLSLQSIRDAKRRSLNLEPECVHHLAEGDDPDMFGRPARPDRMGSSEEMPPPSWTASTKHQRRQSLGVVPSSSSFRQAEASIPERRTGRDWATTDEHGRIASSSSLSASTASELQIRPRIVLSRQHSKSMHHPWQPTLEPTPPKSALSLSRSQSSARQIGPSVAASSTSSEMRRSESDGSSHSLTRTYSEGWGLWSGKPDSPAPSERADSPAPSDDATWWAWGRERLTSVGPASATGLPTRVTPNDDETSTRGPPRARRHSASAADLLGISRTLSLPTDADGSRSSARLAAVLAARSAARPRSTVSISSLSSLDTEASLPSSSVASRPLAPRRMTKSLMRRDLASSVLSKPLAPQLDSASVVSFSGSLDMPTAPLSRNQSYPISSSRLGTPPP